MHSKNIPRKATLFSFFSTLIFLTTIGCSSSVDHGVSNSAPASPIEILDVDLGDKAWGLNLLKVCMKNTDAHQRTLKLHIGAGKRRGDSGLGFGMGGDYVIEPHENRCVEYWYWLPPGHGTVDAIVALTDMTGQEVDSKPLPFFTEEYQLEFNIPNSHCNDLTITKKLPRFKKFYKEELKNLKPFEYFTTKHFVIYASPDTPAYMDIKNIISQRELAIERICDLANVTPSGTIILFFYPDMETKKMCTMHTGHGLARGNTIAEVYNDQVKLDPYHELTHIVMGQIGDPPALFNEGFATYISERFGAYSLKNLGGGESSIYQRVRELKSKNEWIPLDELITYQEIGSKQSRPQVAYPQAAFFVKYLIDTYGEDKFFQAYKQLLNSDNKQVQKKNVEKLKNVYGKPLSELEKQWETIF